MRNAINYAEQKHLNKLREERNKTEQADAKSNERINTKQTSNHNTTHRNEQTQHNRAKAKAKTGPSPKRNTGALPTVPPFPTGEKASGSQDTPESTHEPKGNPGRPKNTQGPKSNNQGPPPVRKKQKQRNTKSKPNPNTKPKT